MAAQSLSRTGRERSPMVPHEDNSRIEASGGYPTAAVDSVSQSHPRRHERTVGDLASKWLELAVDSLSTSTHREYRRLLEKIILPEFATVKVQAVRPSDLENFYICLLRRGVNAGRPLSAQSVHHVHAPIRRLFNQVLKWVWVLSNPALNATPPVSYTHLTLPTIYSV